MALWQAFGDAEDVRHRFREKPGKIQFAQETPHTESWNDLQMRMITDDKEGISGGDIETEDMKFRVGGIKRIRLRPHLTGSLIDACNHLWWKLVHKRH